MPHANSDEQFQAEFHASSIGGVERFVARVRETVSWFATPKGFKKFFDSDGAKSPEKEKEKEKSDDTTKSSDTKKSKSSGSSGGPGGAFDQLPGGWQQFAVSIGVIIAIYLIVEYQSYREISWKEFFHEFLEPGIVDRLEVVDKRWVRIVSSAKTGQTCYFNIGSVDSFERSLAAAQMHLGYDADRQIPVLYKSEFDL
ncbi:hypothetical protein TELCIR_06130 [Teladorsagia circumcincta]|uniref:Peptidase M41 FtsH extracellular domain-containing protein n=1 Tax=Teladorsagia circumcincta TaxID=45464 RepID=A0A2G9UNV6_TELCI|nr:hypothetical protein TELCIR_06130 [Teladorsagia circumcincta]